MSKSSRYTLLTLILKFLLESTVSASDLIGNSNGFKVYRLIANSTDGVQALSKLHDEGAVDFWQKPNLGGNTDLMVNSKQEADLLELISFHGIPYSVVIDDVEGFVSNQTTQKSNRLKMTKGEEMNWEEYQYPETIFNWMDRVSKRFPEICKTYTIGISLEGNPLKLIKISSGGSGKLAVFIDGTAHAREWITTSVSTYIINELLTKSSNYKDLLATYDFYILPIMNPDGYIHSCYYNRLWRKSRRSSDSAFGNLVGCQGVDLNRNFGYHWGGPDSGTSFCSMTYRGSKPFSEPETAAIRNFIFNQSTEVKWMAYFSLHSYGQKWLTPWGFKAELPEDNDELTRVAKIGAKALSSVYNTEFTVGNSQDLLYLASGGSDDWFKGVVGCKYAYTLELRDSGQYGFLLPSSEILPTSVETWAGIAAALKAIPKPNP